MGRDRKLEGDAAEKARQRAREWYRQHRDDVLLRARTINRESRAAAKKRWDEEHKEENGRKRREYYQANAERERQYRRSWYSANREYALESSREYRNSNRERYLKYMREWRKGHDVHRKKYAKKYNSTHGEKNRAQLKDWLKRHPGKSREYEATKRSRHRERITAYQRLWSRQAYAKRGRIRRARLLNAGGSHTAEQIHELWIKQGRKCVIRGCAHPITDKSGKNRYHIDHVVPIARGGPNDISNIQLLCSFHNREKGAMDPYEWAQRHGRLFL